jgi:hypothetical protein
MAGAMYSNEPCGRRWLSSSLQAAVSFRAAAKLSNSSKAKNSSAQPAVEALGIAVLPRTARFDDSISTPTAASLFRIT